MLIVLLVAFRNRSKTLKAHFICSNSYNLITSAQRSWFRLLQFNAVFTVIYCACQGSEITDDHMVIAATERGWALQLYICLLFASICLSFLVNFYYIDLPFVPSYCCPIEYVYMIALAWNILKHLKCVLCLEAAWGWWDISVSESAQWYGVLFVGCIWMTMQIESWLLFQACSSAQHSIIELHMRLSVRDPWPMDWKGFLGPQLLDAYRTVLRLLHGTWACAICEIVNDFLNGFCNLRETWHMWDLYNFVSISACSGLFMCLLWNLSKALGWYSVESDYPLPTFQRSADRSSRRSFAAHVKSLGTQKKPHIYIYMGDSLKCL